MNIRRSGNDWAWQILRRVNGPQDSAHFASGNESLTLHGSSRHGQVEGHTTRVVTGESGVENGRAIDEYDP
jgi:hypothetical protein